MVDWVGDKAAMMLFTDGSVQQNTGIGMGAYLVVSDKAVSETEIQRQIKIKRFENTSSTRLELQIFLYALADCFIKINGECSTIESSTIKSLTIGSSVIDCYTDSQAITGLQARRQKLERNHFCSSKGKPLNNGDLYQEFFALLDQFAQAGIECNICKVAGHKASATKDNIDTLFSIVDKAARRAVRQLDK